MSGWTLLFYLYFNFNHQQIQLDQLESLPAFLNDTEVNSISFSKCYLEDKITAIDCENSPLNSVTQTIAVFIEDNENMVYSISYTKQNSNHWIRY